MNLSLVGKPLSENAKLYQKYAAGSELFLNAVYDEKGLALLHMELHGPMGRIPSLKNRKLPGRNFMANDVKQRLKVMDDMYRLALLKNDQRAPSFGDALVAVLLVCGHRSNRFDRDNCMVTVQDWLEPAHKVVGKSKKRPRGWGCGVINNDSQITPFAFYDRELGYRLAYSMIVVARWDLVADQVKAFVHNSFINLRPFAAVKGV